MRIRLVIIFVLLGLLLAAGAGLFIVTGRLVNAPPVKRVEMTTIPPPAATPTATATPTPATGPRSAPAKTAEPAPTPEPTPTTGTLVINSDVPDTGVFIDRVYIGQAPVTAKDIKPGPHAINVSATGYDGFAETIEVAAGTRTLTYAFKEIRLNATLAAVHKHAIGSCSGTLRATPKGLTYDTTDKNDAFTAPLTDLEVFTVDYLQKNLRIKLKNGKSYNFTDPDGNADKLFVFQRDVEKARQRILSGKVS
jgi:hypothetical protein